MLLELRSRPGCEPLSREPHAVSHYMADLGMWVRRDHRRRGIAEEILRALQAECRALRIPHFSTPFTGASSQHLAAKCGFKVSRNQQGDKKKTKKTTHTHTIAIFPPKKLEKSGKCCYFSGNGHGFYLESTTANGCYPQKSKVWKM